MRHLKQRQNQKTQLTRKRIVYVIHSLNVQKYCNLISVFSKFWYSLLDPIFRVKWPMNLSFHWLKNFWNWNENIKEEATDLILVFYNKIPSLSNSKIWLLTYKRFKFFFTLLTLQQIAKMLSTRWNTNKQRSLSFLLSHAKTSSFLFRYLLLKDKDIIISKVIWFCLKTKFSEWTTIHERGQHFFNLL